MSGAFLSPSAALGPDLPESHSGVLQRMAEEAQDD